MIGGTGIMIDEDTVILILQFVLLLIWVFSLGLFLEGWSQQILGVVWSGI